MYKIKKTTIVLNLILILCGVSLIQLACTGDNPPNAPFNSTVEIVNPPGDINVGPEGLTMQVVEALVLDPDGQPLNDVLVEWRIFGAGVNDFFFDTDGDGVPDVGGLQLVNDEACYADAPSAPNINESGLKCSQISIPLLLSTDAYRDAFVDTPFITLSNDHGISEVSILIAGSSVFDPTTIEVSLGNGSVASVDVTLNQ